MSLGFHKSSNTRVLHSSVTLSGLQKSLQCFGSYLRGSLFYTTVQRSSSIYLELCINSVLFSKALKGLLENISENCLIKRKEHSRQAKNKDVEKVRRFNMLFSLLSNNVKNMIKQQNHQGRAIKARRALIQA